MHFLSITQLPFKGIPVLMYHSISNAQHSIAVTPDNFNRQMGWIKSRFTPVYASDVARWVRKETNLPNNAIAITFDDGYRDNLKYAAPVIKKYKLKATLFLQVMRTKQHFSSIPFLTNSQINKLRKYGWEIQSHTMTHPLLPLLTEFEIKKEFEKSKSEITKLVGSTATMVAYPKGKYSPNVESIASRIYMSAWTVEVGFNNQGDNPFRLKRIPVFKETSFLAFQMHLTPALFLIQTLIKTAEKFKNT